MQLLDFSLHFRKMFMHGFQSVAFKHDKYNRTNRPTLAGANNSFVSDLSSIPSFLGFHYDYIKFDCNETMNKWVFLIKPSKNKPPIFSF